MKRLTIVLLVFIPFAASPADFFDDFESYDIGDDPAAPSLAPFVFPEAVIPPGSTVTFSLGIVQGEHFVMYEVQTDVPDCPIIQTDGNSPPLDTDRRQGIRATIYGSALVANDVSSWSLIKGAYR